MSITDWAEADRPREKMMAKGAAALSDAELLAILLRTGAAGRSAVDVARDVMAQHGNSLVRLDATLRHRKSAQAAVKGLGASKACTIVAALELGRRRAAEEERLRREATVVRSAEDIFAIFNQRLSDLDHEELWALYMSSSGKVLREERISEGGVSFSSADVRKVVRPAIDCMASCVALCHNHPHSTTRPSRDDRDVTGRAKQALALFGIRLLDHVIVCDGQYFSFADSGDM